MGRLEEILIEEWGYRKMERDTIWDFFLKYYPESPHSLLEKGIKVPMPYFGQWCCTYECNNWRKRHGLPLIRKRTKRMDYDLKCIEGCETVDWL